MSLTVDHLTLRAFSPADARGLSDADLIAEQRAFASARRYVDVGASAVAAEIAHRSRRELGYDGLAQRLGAHTPEKLIAQVTGLSGADARTLVRVGELVATPDPWLSPVAGAVSGGGLSLDAAQAIRAGLGSPAGPGGSGPSADELGAAAAALVEAATQLSLEQLAARARAARDELDAAGVPEREEERRDRRFLSLTPLPDGMTRISGLLDPESAAVIAGAVDAITAPRRGGPRFVDTSAAPSATAPDTRTIPQLMVDALVDIVRVATKADTGAVFGKRHIAIRVHVAERDLRDGIGYGNIEGQTASVSVATTERIACDSGMLGIVFSDDGQVLRLSRDQRLFTPKQRIGLAARDGGCRAPGCDRPPEYCEAHHVDEWLRHQGRTDIEDGILLCRHHHMLVHNNGWRVERTAAEYSWVDPLGTRTAMPPKNSLMARLGADQT